MRTVLRILGVVVVAIVVLGVVSVAGTWRNAPRAGHVLDEARLAGVDASAFKAADEPYFHDMDGGIALSPAEVQGRNTWLVWTAGNDRLWDKLTVTSVGALDFLKTLSSHPGLPASRDNRWHYLGLVNEPCFEKASGPDPKRYGLWLDRRSADCPPDPFENEAKYPGVKYGARGKNIPAGSYYGYASGIVGLRLFPNPAFDENAAKKWDADRYYNDPTYYNDATLIRPYRVGMSCAFCHVGPNPIKPPGDPEHPAWANLSSNVGAQYFWIDRIFAWQRPDQKEHNYIWQLFRTSRPGTLDTSLVSTDNINNPRTMNAIYNLGPRVMHAKRWGKETLGGGERDNHQFNDFVTPDNPLAQLYRAPGTVYTPHVLKDGSDSVGAMGALNRVYINIGTFSEEWLLHFNPIVGGKAISPIPIRVARENSAYFKATEAQTFATAAFFLKTTAPHHLADAPGGAKYLAHDDAVITRGKVVFAETCARCHSSKLPAAVKGLDPNGCAGPGYLLCWNAYWDWTKTADFKAQMRAIVLAPDFLKDNYLSTEARIPVTLLHTNACSPLATNALAGNIWNDFSSDSYKSLPSVGDITIYDAYTGEASRYSMPAGGRGYTRPPSLISVWSTAPYLLNNSVGIFDPEPSVDHRMHAFQVSIEQMLWPERREHETINGHVLPGKIDRMTTQTYVAVAPGYLPPFLSRQRDFLAQVAPWLFGIDDIGIEIGPIPKGTPVGLIANLRLISETPPTVGLPEEGALKFILDAKNDLATLPRPATDEQANAKFANLYPQLLKFSKCPDFVVNRGHYFGTGYTEPGTLGAPNPEPGLSDRDKRALIEFVKTF
ncbi:MAG: hypothetical protein NVS3B7_18650 [Candidatus Elarobacter sp.]